MNLNSLSVIRMKRWELTRFTSFSIIRIFFISILYVIIEIGSIPWRYI